MARPLLPDELWEWIEPLLPPQPRGGRPFLDDRKVLTGIIFLLETGIPWEDLPQEMGCGCGMTCWVHLTSGRGGSILMRGLLWSKGQRSLLPAQDRAALFAIAPRPRRKRDDL